MSFHICMTEGRLQRLAISTVAILKRSMVPLARAAPERGIAPTGQAPPRCNPCRHSPTDAALAGEATKGTVPTEAAPSGTDPARAAAKRIAPAGLPSAGAAPAGTAPGGAALQDAALAGIAPAVDPNMGQVEYMFL